MNRWFAVALLFGCGSVATVVSPGDDGGLPDASVADAGHDGGSAATDAGVPCGAVGPTWVCSGDGLGRQRCVGGQLELDPCARGCLRASAGTDATCLTSSNVNTCSGSYGTTPSTSGDYFITAFGCWVDAAGAVHTDPGDNCIPSCLDQARTSGLCLPGDTGPQCEQRVTWFTADGARFGCLARLRVTNPATGKSVIAVALDYGPGCSVENSVSFPVLDTSGRIDRELFGSDQGASDRSLVHVVEVDAATPLGPVP